MVLREKKILTEDTGLFHSLPSEKKSSKNTLFSIIGNKNKQSDRVLYEAFCWDSTRRNMMCDFLYE